MENYRVDEWVRRGYLEALIAAAAITWPKSWQPMEWLTIQDLEALAQLGDEVSYTSSTCAPKRSHFYRGQVRRSDAATSKQGAHREQTKQ